MSEGPRPLGPGYHEIGPYSRALRRGAIRDNIDGRAKKGRLIRDMEAQLIAHTGSSPSFVQRLLIDRVIRIRLQLDHLEAKMADRWTDHDSRTYGGLQNAYLRALRELGLQSAKAKELRAVWLLVAHESPSNRERKARRANRAEASLE
jgi:hypothetical protein